MIGPALFVYDGTDGTLAADPSIDHFNPKF
jgi:hypothetical protein